MFFTGVLMLELKNAKLLHYDTTLDQIFVYGFDKISKLSDNGYYWFKINSKRLKSLNGTYIKIKPIIYFAQVDTDPLKITVVEKPVKLPSTLVGMRGKIEGVYYSHEHLMKKSKLKGFSRVIDDNNYFSKIPIINELTHFDNGVIVSPFHKIHWEYNPTMKTIDITDLNGNFIRKKTVVDDWWNYTLKLEDNNNGLLRLKMTAERGHTHL